MHFTTAFIALLAASQALGAPVTPAVTVDSLVAQANGDPSVVVKGLKPITDQIAALVKSMVPGTPTTIHVDPATLQSVATMPDGPGHPPVENPTGPPAAQPGTDESSSDPNGATPTADNKEAEAEAPAPTDEPADATVQRRNVHEHGTHATSESSTAHHAKATPTKHNKSKSKSKSKKDATSSVKVQDVRKLRDLLSQAKIYEEAIETIFLNSGHNVDEMPSSKTVEGGLWGAVNGPTLAMARMFNFAKDI